MNIEECQLQEVKEGNIKQRSYVSPTDQDPSSEINSSTFTKVRNKKNLVTKETLKRMEATPLKQFETPNPFSVLENNPEEEIDGLIKRLQEFKRIEHMRKAQLKKCRHCNHKSRSCMLDGSNCTASDKNCTLCKKSGHYPKSLNCKKSRQANKSKPKSIDISTNKRKCPKKISVAVLSLMNEKIHNLEAAMLQESNLKSNIEIKQERKVPPEVVPFVMMFLFLNHDFIRSSDSDSAEGDKDKLNLKRLILKESNYCARKFCSLKHQNRKQYFSTYCSKRIKSILGIKPPSKDKIGQSNNILDVFDKMYYKQDFDPSNESLSDTMPDDNIIESQEEDQFSIINNEYSSSESEIDDQMTIPQLDGHLSDASEDEENITKKIFSVNCETNEIIQVVTFFRSFDFFWNILASHKLCSTKSSDQKCFFCHMRSSCIRLRASRGRGPKGLKLVEFTSQLNQYQSFEDWNWRDNKADLPTFIENTLKLFTKYETKTSDYFGMPQLKCQKCKKIRKVANQLVYCKDTSSLIHGEKEVNLKLLVEDLITENDTNHCCRENSMFNAFKEKCVIFHLSQPVSVSIAAKENLYGGNFTILSVVNQKNENEEINLTSSLMSKVKCIFKTEKEKSTNLLNVSKISKYCQYLLPSQKQP